MSCKHIIPGIINQGEPPVLPVSQVKTETSMVIKNEPESEMMEIGVDNILDSSDIPDIKDIDIVWYPLCEDSIKSETLPENILESKHSEFVEDFIQTENTPFIKLENINQNETLNKSEDISDGKDNRGTGQEAIEMQVESNKQILLNHSKNLNGISARGGKAKHSKLTNFTECYKNVETTSWKKDKEKIKVIEAPLIPVEPHEFTSLAKDKYVCNHCQHTSNLLQSIRRHIKLRHRKVTTMYQCPYCSFKSKRKPTLQGHIIHKHKDPKDIQWFQCHLCEKKFKFNSDMTRHMNVHLTLDQMQDRLEFCSICGKVFKSKYSMINHMSLIHNKMKRKSQECKYTTTESELLEHHIKNTHKKQRQKTKEEMDDQDLKYCCDKCNYKTYRSNSLKMHKLVHLKPEEIQYFYCYHCSYKCPRKSQLKKHIFTHYKQIKYQSKHKKQLEKRYHCDKCDYKTYTNPRLKRHKLIHLKPEEIQYCYCYHCSFKAKHKDSLKAHISRHFRKEDIPFHCYICNFIKMKRESIIEHIKKHVKVQIKSKINEGN